MTNQLMSDELGYLDFIKGTIQEAPVLIDVGMEEGRFSQEFIERFPNCIIYGFEPICELVKATSNRFKDLLFDKIFIYNFLLGSEVKLNSIVYKAEGGCSSSYIREKLPGIPRIVPTLKLDIFSYLFPEKIDYIKIDVEGDELNVLKGAILLLQSKRVKYIQFEINDEDAFNRSLKDIRDFLNPYQYIIRNDNLDVITDFTKPHKYDVQNYLAELVV